MDKIAHGFFCSDADGLHGFFIFLMMKIICKEWNHTDARLRLRLTDLHGSHGFSDLPLRTIAPCINTTAGQPAPVGGSALSVLSVRSRKHEAKPSVSVNPTTYGMKLYKKIREIRQHPSPKIRV